MQCLEAEDVHTKEPTLNIDNMSRRQRQGLKDILEHMVEETRSERARAEREREEEEAEVSGREQVGDRCFFFCCCCGGVQGGCGESGRTWARCISDLVEGFVHNVVKCSQACQEQQEQLLMNKRKTLQISKLQALQPPSQRGSLCHIRQRTSSIGMKKN